MPSTTAQKPTNERTTGPVAWQCLAYLARPWAAGDAASFVREFVCECADPECDAVVELAVAAFPGQPLLAPGHC